MTSSLKYRDPSTEDVECVLAAARQGERSQLGVLLDLYRGYLLTIATEKLGQAVSVKAAPSDLVQETLLQASKAFAEFRGSTELELREWLRQILTRELIDVHRQYCVFAKRDLSREVRLYDDSIGEHGILDLAARVEPPSARARSTETVRLVQEAIEKLAEDQSQAIQLRNFEHLSFEEIGTRLGKSAEAARKIWTRAVQNLTVELRRHDPGSS